MKKTFVIDYNIFYKNGSYSHPSPMRIKNCLSELHAKSRLEDFLKRNNPTFSRLVVLSCKTPPIGSMFDFLGKNNPFS